MIFSTHTLHPEVTAALQAIGPYRVATAPTPQAIVEGCADAEIIVVRAPIPVAVLARAPGLRALIRHGAGLDMVPLPEATAAGVLVANVPGANAVTVAEHVVWTSLALLRLYPQASHDLRTRGWTAGRAHADHGRELSGRMMGILGMGNIGQALARMVTQGFGMRVLCHTRTPSRVPAGVTAVDYADMLAGCDILAICAPLTDQTRGMVDARALARMKPGALLVNVARGPLVVEAAVLEALQSGHLGGAALDVFDTQPLPADHPFLDLSNVILTPHLSGVTEESMLRMGQGVVAEVRRVLAGMMPINFVNPEVETLYRQRFSG